MRFGLRLKRPRIRLIAIKTATKVETAPAGRKMNERIKELAEQVGFGWDDKYHWYVGSRQMEKFAALIVRECLQVAQTELLSDEIIDKETHSGVRDYFLGNNCGINESIHSIKLHFGIEE
jgi:hypothetical protein